MTAPRRRKGDRPLKAPAADKVAEAERVNVVVVGGGMGGLTAAYELSHPRHGGRYDITVYQMGWRLGGKGASGRNRDKSNRIEEHGLHVWMGFYENAFRMMRECYEELGKRAGGEKPAWEPKGGAKPPPPPFATIEEAFRPDNHVGVAAPSPDKPDEWEAWTSWFPPMEGMPGDPMDDKRNPFTLHGYAIRFLFLARTLFLSLLKESGARDDKRSDLDEILDKGREEFRKRSPRLIIEQVTAKLRSGSLTAAAGLFQGVLILETVLKDRQTFAGNDLRVLEFLDAAASSVRSQLRDIVKIEPRLRRKTEVIDLVMTCVAGLLRDDVLASPEGLDAIDHYDAREWLLKHGASWSSLDSPILRGLYDMAFAEFVDLGEESARRATVGKIGPDGRRRGLAAGQALRCTMRMFYTYRGALFWRMRSAMGEVVFAPLYHLLKARGVKFRFFHRLSDIEVEGDGGGRYVSKLVFDRQLRDAAADLQYEPLFKPFGADDRRPAGYAFDSLHAWPSAPNVDAFGGPKPAAEQLDPAALESFWGAAPGGTLELTVSAAGERPGPHEFDMVVLALGLGAIQHLRSNGKLQSLDEDESGGAWAQMLNRMQTVPTQAFQLWLKKGMFELGWSEPPVTLAGIGRTDTKTFDTWADMTPILPFEGWDFSEKGDPPGALAYFCGAMRGTSAPRLDKVASQVDDKATLEQAAKNVEGLMNGPMASLWKGAATGRGMFDWGLLVSGEPEDRMRQYPSLALKSQFVTAAVNPSDRYVLTVPGSSAYRISPLDTGIVNLTVAGDWTACGFHGGCIEAAVMSGRLAAHALSGFPGLDAIVGYDHP
jgi:uncharacterized protein with NAD-binding domain and iron-sulfur cluster